jgi:hypothetical protein
LSYAEDDPGKYRDVEEYLYDSEGHALGPSHRAEDKGWAQDVELRSGEWFRLNPTETPQQVSQEDDSEDRQDDLGYYHIFLFDYKLKKAALLV